MKRQVWICSALLCGLFAIPAGAQPAAMRAQDAYNRHDYATALREWRWLATRDHDQAQYNLGVMYARGDGVARDDAEAARWYREAAVRGHARAQYNLGNIHFEGHGVTQDYVQAHMWLSLAASRAQRVDQKRFSERRDEVAARMTPEQIAEAKELARKWRPKLVHAYQINK